MTANTWRRGIPAIAYLSVYAATLLALSWSALLLRLKAVHYYLVRTIKSY